MAEKDREGIEITPRTYTQNDSDFLLPKICRHILSYFKYVHVQIKHIFLCTVETPFGFNYNKSIGYKAVLIPFNPI